jgi:hypothetical protein
MCHDLKTAMIAISSCSRGSLRKLPSRAVAEYPLELLGLLPGVRIVLGVREILDAAHRLAKHLDEAPVRVPSERRIAADCRESGHAGIGEPDIEYRLHHPRHREHGSGADGDEQGIGRVAQPAAHGLLERAEVLVDLSLEGRRKRADAKVCPAASVVMMKPGGTGSPSRVISARFAPLPPRSSFMPIWPSTKS